MGNIISYFFPQPEPARIEQVEEASQDAVAACDTVSAVPVYETQNSEIVRNFLSN